MPSRQWATDGLALEQAQRSAPTRSPAFREIGRHLDQGVVGEAVRELPAVVRADAGGTDFERCSRGTAVRGSGRFE